MKKLMSMFLASALLLAVLTGCGFTGSSTQSPSGGEGESGGSTRDTLVYYDSNEIRTLVQWAASDTQSFTILNNAFEGLFRLDANHEPQPALAESYTVSDDGLVYTFTLRGGLQWSNGTALTANDFVFAWLKQMSADATNGYNFIMTDYIVNGLEYGEGTATADQVGVKALDDRTLEVTIKNPTPYFLYLTTLSMYFPLNEEYVTEQGDNYGITADNMIYCGPYVITSYDPAVGTSMAKNETYWDAASVSIPKVEVKIIKDQSSALNTYLAGDLDKVNLSSADVPTYESNPEFHTVTEFRSTYLQFNLDDPAMANLNIRKALGYAIDRSILADTILADGSTAAEGLVSFGVSGNGTETFRELNGNLSPFDADLAKEYWAKGVEELGYEPELSMLIADDSATKQIATFVQSQFRDNLGIEVAIDSKTSKARNELMDNNNYQFAITAWGADYDDAMTFLDLWIASADTGKSTPYRGNYANPAYTDLITSAKADANSETRLQSLLDAEKLLVDTDAVISPLYFKGFAYLQRSDVQDLIVHPLGNPVEFKYASFSTAE
ncbi:peptide ABC transporter substrate-binding protein [Flavonifractor sp. AGMB03687]|uniref:peptide ABC transporter substrate-binding protein n=1 Tax=Flavonifractor sp. AGMB03687 TaxID=2785133 RepID=UPI001ADEC4DB|nr:peptide ABC transporter substrate-binding protein [Flavonifractor sp. AGMB03687]